MRNRWIALVLVLALLMGMTACTNSGEETTESTVPTTEPTTVPTTQPPEPTAHELFAQAAELIKTADNVSMTFETKEEHKVWKDTFLHVTKGTAVFEGLQKDLLAKIDTTVSYNDGDEIPYTELFVGGTTYATYDGYLYRDETEQEDFLERQYPVCLFNADNFEIGEVEEGEDGKILKFSDATAMEEWLAPEYAVLTEATAQAVLGDKGIASMTYTATYSQGAADITVEVTTTPVCGKAAELSAEAPEDAESYVLLSDCRAPMIMDRAMANLNAAESSSAHIIQLVINQAAGVMMSSSQINLSHYGEKPYMKEDLSLNYMSPNGDQELEVVSTYKNGVLTVENNGKSQAVKETDEYIEEYVQGVYNDNLVEPAWITGCEAGAMGELFYIEFTSDDESCLAYFKSRTNAVMFGSEDPVGEIASGYEDKSFECYMGVDPDTWLPVSYGFEYVGAYTIEGEEYEHSQKYYSRLMGSDPMAYHEITDTYLKEARPETPATPLFYHVTGEDGSEMWLLGTIHVGDERTAYLPQEIYDAFEASDALAVEFNLNADDERMEEDEDYADKIMSLYFYDDDSETKEHLDEELYEAALKMLKCLGQYNPNMDMAKPFVWESSITAALKDGGRRLFSEKGVDQRFLDLAEDAEKEILDVESAEDQTAMFSNFSDALQERLLAEALSYSRSEYNREILELFELWCAGDEEALRKYINDEESEDEEEDTSEMTEEEKALYEEYENAMSTERNINMIEVAKEYLTSGKTVFYAVGLAHLLKDDGLVDGLRAAGYTVELVEYKQ